MVATLFDPVLMVLGVAAVALGIYNWLINQNLNERLEQLEEQLQKKPANRPE